MTGMTADEVEALKFGLELHASSVRQTNQLTNSMIENLMKENEELMEENNYLKSRLYPLVEGLRLIKFAMDE
jgi:hypothetical protein